MKWQIFKYNFGCPDYVWLLDGWISRLTLGIPIVGYLILFNDTISGHLQFNSLASESLLRFGISSSSRLKFVYLGLLLIGIANIAYRLARPYVMKIGVNQFEYVETALKHFTFSSYLQMHEDIRHSKYGAHTGHGKYYDSEWEGFKLAAIGSDTLGEGRVIEAHWLGAKNQYESLLRSILIETYSRQIVRRRWRLVFCIILAAVGYALLSIPSLDLFAKVMFVILSPIFSSSHPYVG
ncbi:hypothetical protein BH10PSE7_BH10PSE7_22640 [soil metagenome]